MDFAAKSSNRSQKRDFCKAVEAIGAIGVDNPTCIDLDIQVGLSTPMAPIAPAALQKSRF
jgi:hypothetical protein